MKCCSSKSWLVPRRDLKRRTCSIIKTNSIACLFFLLLTEDRGIYTIQSTMIKHSKFRSTTPGSIASPVQTTRSQLIPMKNFSKCTRPEIQPLLPSARSVSFYLPRPFSSCTTSLFARKSNTRIRYSRRADSLSVLCHMRYARFSTRIVEAIDAICQFLTS